MEKIKNIFLSKNVLSRLLLINTSIFLLIVISGLFLNKQNGFNFIGWYFSLPAEFSQILARPWTIITSMFSHVGLLHFAFNMLILWFSGKIFLSYAKEKNLLYTYLIGGLVGSIFYVVSYNVFPMYQNILPMSIALGASGAIMAILFSAIYFAPNLEIRLFFVIKMKLKYLALILIVSDILGVFGSNSGGHLAHIGGAIFGLSYAMYLKGTPKFIKDFKRKIKRNQQIKKRRFERSNEPEVSMDVIDRILDKISKYGYSNLSKEEKNILFKSKIK
jgi:membrane associated rhomboid family serine protease